MRSALPKVLHPVGGCAMLGHVLARIGEVNPKASIALVVGHKHELVREYISKDPNLSQMNISFAYQAEQKGTGHAVMVAMDSEWGAKAYASSSAIMVLPGDQPLVTTDLIRQMSEPLAKNMCMRMLTAEVPDSKGYGRVIRRGKQGAVIRIVEEKDATDREREVKEIGTSTYLFQPAFLKASLRRLSNKNAQNEYYLTDTVSIGAAAKRTIDVLKWSNWEDLRGVNQPWELAIASRLLNERLLRQWSEKGVRFIDPASTWVESRVEFGEDVEVEPGVILKGSTRIGQGVKLGARVILTNVSVGDGAVIKAGTIAEDSSIGAKASVGPYAHLRPGSKVGESAKIGNFVELKQTQIGANTSVAHLSYLGDATVGSRVNIGCGFVTCNFDGRVIDGKRKHETVIEDDVFMGSDCQTVAPVRIGKGSYVASGSTITQDVEPESLAIARSRQVNKKDYAKRFRGKDGGH